MDQMLIFVSKYNTQLSLNLIIELSLLLYIQMRFKFNYSIESCALHSRKKKKMKQ